MFVCLVWFGLVLLGFVCLFVCLFVCVCVGCGEKGELGGVSGAGRVALSGVCFRH